MTCITYNGRPPVTYNEVLSFNGDVGYSGIYAYNAPISFNGCISPPVPDEVIEGGIGHGKKRKKRPIYIERDGQIILFDNAYQAAQWVSAEKLSERPEKRKKVVKLVQKLPTPKVIDLPKTETLAIKYDLVAQYKQLMVDFDFHALYEMMLKLIEMQEEDDLIVLLMAA